MELSLDFGSLAMSNVTPSSVSLCIKAWVEYKGKNVDNTNEVLSKWKGLATTLIFPLGVS